MTSIMSRFTRVLNSTLHTISPILIPALICLLLVPLAVLISVYAGWVVWTSAAVGWQFPVHLQYGDGVPPYAEVLLKDLSARQYYDISLHLQIPAVESNLNLGNFMTTFSLSTLSNNTLASTRRPTMVIMPRRNLFFFWRGRPNLIQMDIPLLYAFAPRYSNILAHVELGRQDNWKSLGNGYGREVSVLSASIKGILQYHGVRGLVARFPLLFAASSTLIFLAISLSIIATCVLPTIHWPEVSGAAVELQNPAVELSDEQRRRRRRTKHDRARSSTSHHIKTESSSNPSPTRLRRRQSRITTDSDA